MEVNDFNSLLDSYIPKKWSSSKLKYQCETGHWAKYGANIPSEEYVNEGVRFLRTSDFDDYGNLYEDNEVFVSDKYLNEYGLKDKDILISRSGTIGRTLIYDPELGECVYAGYLVRFRLKEGKHPKFFFYFTQSSFFDSYISNSIIQSTIGNVNGQKYANFKFSVPDFSTQKQIADFLDKETTRIDTLISKKQKQIELLQEKRQAIITQSVTKGLDPTVKMKDSGVEWIGEIPEHWDTIPIKFLGKIQNGYAFDSNEFTTGGVRVMKISNIQTMRVDWEDESYIDKGYYQSLPQFRVYKNDLVFALTRPIISTGIKACIVDYDEEILLNQRNAVLRPSEKLNMKWMYYIIIDKIFTHIFEMEIDKTGQQPNISTSKIGNLKIPFPKKDEQNEIVEYLDRECGNVNILIDKVSQSINLLKEYRSSLITHAVSGQIDITQYEVSE